MGMDHIIGDTYRIEQEIGSGSGGTVYKGWHLRLNKPVVLKRINSKAMNLLDIRKEADILKNLHHPYLPQVFDFIEMKDSDGRAAVFTVMDFVPGQTFDALIKSGKKFTVDEAAKYLRQLCEAVNYLHTQNPPIIHGDIKPANIILTPEDNICLIDFNISGVSEDMEILGFTPGFAAPEQVKAAKTNQRNRTFLKGQSNIKGGRIAASDDGETEIAVGADPDETEISLDDDATEIDSAPYNGAAQNAAVSHIDSRVDIYAVGATIYTVLTGMAPDPNYTKDLTIAATGKQVSDAFSFIIEKAVKRNPAERFLSMQAMLNAMSEMGRKDARYKRLLTKQVITIIIFIFLAAGSAAVSFLGYKRMKSERAAEHFAKVQELYDKKDYEGVIEYVHTGATVDESIYDGNTLGNIYYIAGDSSFELSEYDSAINFYRQSLAADTMNKSVYCNYAISLARIGKYKEAEEIIDDAIRSGISDDQVHLMKGELAAAQGNIPDAEKNLSSAIMLTKDEYLKTRAYLKYSDMYSENPAYLSDEALINKNIDVLSQAKESVTDEYKFVIQERLGGAYSALAALKKDAALYGQAASVLKEVVESGKGTLDTYMNLALMYQNAGNLELSRDTYMQALKVYGDNYPLYQRLALLEVDIQGDLEQSQRDYSTFQSYFDKAEELFAATGGRKDQNAEMAIMEQVRAGLVQGGWLK